MDYEEEYEDDDKVEVGESILEYISLKERFCGVKLLPVYDKKSDCIFLLCTLTEFIAFCKENGITNVFYQYEYYEEDDYIVKDDLIEEETESREEYDYCMKWASTINAKLQKIDFNKPMRLILSCIYQSQVMKWIAEDEWLPDEYEKAEEALESFRIEHSEEIEHLSGFNKEELKAELTSKMLSDPHFRTASNRLMRSAYCAKFIEKEENQIFNYAFDDHKDYMLKYNISTFIDTLYSQYKAECKIQGIHPGEPLKTPIE